jgi:hypothetical protein
MCGDVLWAIPEWMPSPSSGSVICGFWGERLSFGDVCIVWEGHCL